MKQHWTVWALFGAGFFLFFLLLSPHTVSGQQGSQANWQGIVPHSPPLQSSAPSDSSQQPTLLSEQSLTPRQPQRLPPNDTRAVPHRSQSATPTVQGSETPGVQHEIPAVWPPQPAATHVPGYLGAQTKSFYRGRFCMHAMTIEGVEVTAVAPNSPAERAGLRTARGLTAREAAVATVAGLLTLSPVAPVAASVARAAGGVYHGDIILAVGGKRVKTQEEFERALTRFGPDTVVYLTIRRGEAAVQIPVRLDDWPASTPRPELQQARATATETGKQ